MLHSWFSKNDTPPVRIFIRKLSYHRRIMFNGTTVSGDKDPGSETNEDKYVNMCFTIRSASTAGSESPPALTTRFSVGCEGRIVLICASTTCMGSTAIPSTAVTSEFGLWLSMAVAAEIVEWDWCCAGVKVPRRRNTAEGFSLDSLKIVVKL